MGRCFLGHHYYTLILSETCPRIEKKIFFKIHQFDTFNPKISSRLGGGSWNLQFLVSLPYRCYIPNLVKIGSVVLQKKMLMDDGWLTMDNHGRQPIAIGHLSDSGDLIKYYDTFKSRCRLWISPDLQNTNLNVHIKICKLISSAFKNKKYKGIIFNLGFKEYEY